MKELLPALAPWAVSGPKCNTRVYWLMPSV